MLCFSVCMTQQGTQSSLLPPFKAGRALITPLMNWVYKNHAEQYHHMISLLVYSRTYKKIKIQIPHCLTIKKYTNLYIRFKNSKRMPL